MHVVRSLSALFLRTCRTFSSPSDVSEFTSCYLRVARRPDLGVALGVLLEAAAFEAVLGVAVRPDLGAVEGKKQGLIHIQILSRILMKKL